MASLEDGDSPQGLGERRRKESHKSLPHHDSLRELELKEKTEARRSKKFFSDNINKSGNNINKNEQFMVEPTPTPALNTTPDNSDLSLLEQGGAQKTHHDKDKKKGHIVAAADIEITPQERLHVQDTLDPEIHRIKEKKPSKIKKLRRKPVKDDKAPRRVFFNDPPRNASFKYLLMKITVTCTRDCS